MARDCEIGEEDGEGSARTGDRDARRSDDPTPGGEGRKGFEIQATLTMLSCRVGKHWAAVDHDQVAAAIERQRGIAEAMRRVSLANSDEPELIFVPRTSLDRDA